MKKLFLQFDKVCKSFGEDPKKSQPDEFFGVFDLFLQSFTDARLENERFKKQKEEEKKREKLEEKVCNMWKKDITHFIWCWIESISFIEVNNTLETTSYPIHYSSFLFRLLWQRKCLCALGHDAHLLYIC